MFVKIGPYRDHWSCYKFFERFEPYIGEKRADWLHDRVQPILNFLWNERSWAQRKIKIRIDGYDIWCMYDTLGMIILPMLYKMQEDKHGAPYVDDEDVPEHLKSTAAPAKENDYDIDDNHFKRWDYVVGEMIWAFEELKKDFPDEHCWTVKGEFADPMFEKIPDSDNYEMKWKVEPVLDKAKYDAYHDRNKRAFTLFGKYFTSLWT